MSEIIIKQVDFKEHFSDIEAIRTAVFIKEQHVPIELEWDEFDNDSTHILAYYDNNPVGTVRLLNDGHISRMAVLKGFRKRKIGENMLKYILELAHTKLLKKVELSAQDHAVKFYEKYGFCVTSDVYLDAGIPHYTMVYCK